MFYYYKFYFHDIPHDEFLAAKICQGLRPKSDYKIPQLILDIIEQCWDANPLKRPKAAELKDLFWNLYEKSDKDYKYGYYYKENSTINKQIKESWLPTLSSTGVLSYTNHAQAVYTSRLLNYKNLPEPKNADNNDNSFETEYSGNYNSMKLFLWNFFNI